MLFVIGGDGSNRAAQDIHQRCKNEGLPCCVVGIPKSIENDFLLIDKWVGSLGRIFGLTKPMLALYIAII